MRFIQLYRDAARSIPAHHLLMLTDRSRQIPGSATIHLVEPEERDGAPGVVDGLQIDFRQADEIISAGIGAQERVIATSAGSIKRAVIFR